MNWSYVLERNAEKYPKKEAIVFEDKRITYKELNQRVNALAKGLLDLGISKGDVCAIMTYNCSEFIELTFATNKVGAIWLPLNWRLATEELIYTLNDARAKVIFSDIEFCDTINPMKDRLSGIKAYICLGSVIKNGWHSYDELVSKNLESKVPTIMVEMDDIHRLMYTSGTTAKPKGVMVTYGNLYWKCVIHSLEFNFSSSDKCIIVLPLYHTAGMDLPASSIIYLGGTTIILRRFNPIETLKTIESEKVTCTCLTPSVINMLFAEPAFETYDLSSLKVLIDGGEKMPAPLVEKVLKEFPGTWFSDGYGLTETVTGDTFLRSDEILEKKGSVGRPVAMTRVRIVDDNGNEVPRGSLGEILLRGPKVFKGYWNNTEATNEVLKDGWFYTGDIGRLDEEGYLYIVDRKKDMIKSGGENIASAEVEAVIYKLPQVYEVAVVGVPHPKWLEVAKAFVVLKKGQKLTAEEIVAHCQQWLAKFKLPKEVEFISELPRTPPGKVLKRDLRKK